MAVGALGCMLWMLGQQHQQILDLQDRLSMKQGVTPVRGGDLPEPTLQAYTPGEGTEFDRMREEYENRMRYLRDEAEDFVPAGKL
jgi:hypothetical protein